MILIEVTVYIFCAISDFIVGAPYDGEDGRGAVYVYHGAKDGLRKEPTQKIEARKVHADLRAFGYSLAGGKDIDRNQYPGLLAQFMSLVQCNYFTPAIL